MPRALCDGICLSGWRTGRHPTQTGGLWKDSKLRSREWVGFHWAKRLERREPSKTQEWKESSTAGVEPKKGAAKGTGRSLDTKVWAGSSGQVPVRSLKVYPRSSGKALEVLSRGMGSDLHLRRITLPAVATGGRGARPETSLERGPRSTVWRWCVLPPRLWALWEQGFLLGLLTLSQAQRTACGTWWVLRYLLNKQINSLK